MILGALNNWIFTIAVIQNLPVVTPLTLFTAKWVAAQ
jgi:hypothetical protein